MHDDHDHFSFDEFFSTSYMRVAATGVLAILALFLLVETLATASSISHPTTAPADTITVSGTGMATVIPDVAKIDYTVTEDASTVADAQSAATTKSNAALAALAGDGIAATDMKTVSYNVSPQYANNTCQVNGPMLPAGVSPIPMPCSTSPVVTGYEVSQGVEVTVRDTSKAGDVLQELGTLGVENIDGPNFTVDDPTTVQAEARADAISKAKTSAQLLAAQLGVHLGRVVNFSDNGGTEVPQAFSSNALAGEPQAAMAPTLPVGQNEVTSNVSITYEID